MQGGKGEQRLLLAGWNPNEEALPHPRKGSGIVPKAARVKVLQLAHNSMTAGHFGQERTMEAIRRRIDWPGIATDVRELCKSCPICQKAKPAVVAKDPLHPLPILKDPFQRIAMDIFGPLRKTKLVINTFLLLWIIQRNGLRHLH